MLLYGGFVARFNLNSENDNKSDDGPERNIPPGNVNWRGYFLYLLIFSLIFYVVLIYRGDRESVVELTYSQFTEHLEEGRVLSVTVVKGQGAGLAKLEGVLKNEEATPSEFYLTLPTEDVSDELLSKLEAAQVEINGKNNDGGFWPIIIGILPWLIFFVVLIFIFKRLSAAGGGSGAFGFGKSKAKELKGEFPDVTFGNVAGCDEAKAELQEVVEFLRNPHKFEKLGGRMPKGTLMVGPPGTGKTLLSRAVAGEAKRPFFQMSGSDFVEMFVGVGASRVRDLFEKAKKAAPCIIFIDEIDAVGRQRGAGLGGGHDEREQTLNALLVAMDGFEESDNVIVIAATNRPDVLDPALLRAGRFDRRVTIGMPDVLGREKILEVHAKNKPLDPEVDLSVIARGTSGLSGADLANLLNEAALVAARRRGSECILMQDIEKARDKIMFGKERKSMVLTEDERVLTAYHEAGHAVIALKYPHVLDPLHKVTIVPRGQALGITASLPEKDRYTHSREWIEAQLVMFFGGRAAEELVFGNEKVTTGAGNDIERATQIARNMVTKYGMSDKVGLVNVANDDDAVFLGREIGSHRNVSERTMQLVDEEVRRLTDDAYDKAKKILAEERDELLERIAQVLLDRETIDRKDIELLESGKDLPPLEMNG